MPTRPNTTEPYEQTTLPSQTAPLPAVYERPMVSDWAIDEQSGVPVRVLRPAPVMHPVPEPAPAAPVRDPWPARLLAGGAAVSLTATTLGIFADDLAVLKGPAFALAALVFAVWLVMHTGGRKQGAVNVNVRVDNRGR